MRSIVKHLTTAAAVAVTGTLVFGATPAAARPEVLVNDSFGVLTDDSGECGYVKFVDYGEGKPGGGKNDDYITISDRCWDGYGIKAFAWVDGRYFGVKYNANGTGTKVIWDPFGNVESNREVTIKVCLVDDGYEYYCDLAEHTLKDG